MPSQPACLLLLALPSQSHAGLLQDCSLNTETVNERALRRMQGASLDGAAGSKDLLLSILPGAPFGGDRRVLDDAMASEPCADHCVISCVSAWRQHGARLHTSVR